MVNNSNAFFSSVSLCGGKFLVPAPRQAITSIGGNSARNIFYSTMETKRKHLLQKYGIAKSQTRLYSKRSKKSNHQVKPEVKSKKKGSKENVEKKDSGPVSCKVTKDGVQCTIDCMKLTGIPGTKSQSCEYIKERRDKLKKERTSKSEGAIPSSKCSRDELSRKVGKKKSACQNNSEAAKKKSSSSSCKQKRKPSSGDKPEKKKSSNCQVEKKVSEPCKQSKSKNAAKRKNMTPPGVKTKPKKKTKKCKIDPKDLDGTWKSKKCIKFKFICPGFECQQNEKSKKSEAENFVPCKHEKIKPGLRSGENEEASDQSPMNQCIKQCTSQSKVDSNDQKENKCKKESKSKTECRDKKKESKQDCDKKDKTQSVNLTCANKKPSKDSSCKKSDTKMKKCQENDTNAETKTAPKKVESRCRKDPEEENQKTEEAETNDGCKRKPDIVNRKSKSETACAKNNKCKKQENRNSDSCLAKKKSKEAKSPCDTKPKKSEDKEDKTCRPCNSKKDLKDKTELTPKENRCPSPDPIQKASCGKSGQDIQKSCKDKLVKPPEKSKGEVFLFLLYLYLNF